MKTTRLLVLVSAVATWLCIKATHGHNPVQGPSCEEPKENDRFEAGISRFATWLLPG